ncbi:MAG: transposase [Alphaproteobacteria bacterium]|nr:transposase [Alphaproteobacteria bacterium]
MVAEIATVNGRIDHEREAAGQAPFRALSREICNVPGINVRSADMILAETGLNMGRFATAVHIVAYTGLCPGQNESGGKREPAQRRSVAQDHAGAMRGPAIKKKDSYFRAQFRRLKARRVAPKPSARWPHPLLTTIYHMLKDGTAYRDPRSRSL